MIRNVTTGKLVRPHTLALTSNRESIGKLIHLLCIRADRLSVNGLAHKSIIARMNALWVEYQAED